MAKKELSAEARAELTNLRDTNVELLLSIDDVFNILDEDPNADVGGLNRKFFEEMQEKTLAFQTKLNELLGLG